MRRATSEASRIGAAVLATALLVSTAPGQPAGGAGFEGVRWGDTSDALLAQFGARATRLDRPLDFGQAYVDVVLRRHDIGGFPYIVYFQMDRASGRLIRIQIERPRHGAVAMAHRAAVAALEARYGTPTHVCQQRVPKLGGQAIDERIWRQGELTVRLVFREQSLGVLQPRRPEPFDSDVWEPSLEGLPQQLFIRLAPAGTEPDVCSGTP
jgi:hypothetical protein